MINLGTTKNPRELIPGSPDSINDVVATLRRQSTAHQRISDDLKSVKISRWSGDASTAFREAFDREPHKWSTLSGTVTRVADALAKHANALRDAQAEAEQAITLWERGEAATREATGTTGSTTSQHVSRSDSLTPASPDPGDENRQQAEQVLARARQRVRDSGDRVASEISAQNPQGHTRSALAQLADTVAGAYKPDAGASETRPSKNSLGELKAYAQLVDAHAQGATDVGPVKLSGSAGANVGANATTTASVSGEGLSGKADASAGATASAQGGASLGPASESASLDGFAGAKAGVSARAGKTGVEANANAFAGARGTVTESADIGGIGISESAEGWAGPGAEAGLTFGKKEDGKWRIGANAGVSPVLGGKVGAQITVDPAKVERTAHEASEAVGHLPSTVGHSVGSAERTISGWIH